MEALQMKNYSELDIDGLISCPKLIVEPPKKQMRLERGILRNDMGLHSVDGDLNFAVFMRINETFRENFSIGLTHSPSDEPGELCLLRFNGPHGEFLGAPDTPHFVYHIHRATPESILAGLRPERGGKATSLYASYDQALYHFLKMVNVENMQEFFADLTQMDLAFNQEQNRELP
jgi:hypothetical protein